MVKPCNFTLAEINEILRLCACVDNTLKNETNPHAKTLRSALDKLGDSLCDTVTERGCVLVVDGKGCNFVRAEDAPTADRHVDISNVLDFPAHGRKFDA